MLTFLGGSMVAAFMTLIMTRRMSALVALVVVPIGFGLIASGLHIGPMMLDGLQKLGPTAAMLMFSIVYFSIMTDAGVFDPVVRGVLHIAHGDPLRIYLGTACMGIVVALDGDGSTTYMICVSALLPIYKRLGLSLQYMATLLVMSIGIMNILPWGGPSARAASAMHLDVADVFVPLIPVMLVGFAYNLCVATVFGLRERRRVGVLSDAQFAAMRRDIGDVPDYRRPNRLWFNIALTGVLLVSLVIGLLPLPILFIIASALALMINYPSLAEQKERLTAHAYNIISVVGLILAAGVFTGILFGTGMVEAMSKDLLSITPQWLGPYLAPATALLSGVATYAVTNDAFYFGMLPILAQTAQAYGISATEMASASLIGQPMHLLSPLVASTYLLVALLDINYGDNQKRSFPWVIGLMLVMLASSILFGVIPLRGSLS
ncbi:CitMHS family transporter [Azotobacter beijerinckii]|uniref:CitMHS family transporter n=1 Tax=Azotobacter beijerinckii TaxID=170623 RepID=UPI0029550D3C|nr:citrate:proton symporter [Azotobacter beijerinckii]MDV7213240.1 citrate:proton symporter [Azotobacter beijerinckii]